MKKFFIILLLLFFISPQYTNTFAITKNQYHEQKILTEFKNNKNIQLSEGELKQAIERTKSELLSLHLNVIAKGYKTSHICYPNSVIKQIKIYIDQDSFPYDKGTLLIWYYDAYGVKIGSIAYKNNVMVMAIHDKLNTEEVLAFHRAKSVSYVEDKTSRIGDMNVNY